MRHWSASSYRPLPRSLAPASDETVNSYLRRLAQANRLDATALRNHLTGSARPAAPLHADDLALLSGQHPRTLRYAILELNTIEELSGTTHLAHRPRPGGIRQLHCTHCTLSRGHRGNIWRWSHPEHVICLRHQRWIGGGDEPGHTTQPDLREHPEILRAHQRHRKLIRRHGRTKITTVFAQAYAICKKWHEQHQHRHDYERLMAQFHGPAWRVLSSDPTVTAARYPQAIELTTLLALRSQPIQPHQQSPEPTPFAEAVRRTVAPEFHWNTTTHYGYLDPLVSLIINHAEPHQLDPPNLFPARQSNKLPQIDETTRTEAVSSS